MSRSIRWLAWKNESRGGKQTKVPKTAHNTAATSTAPDTWAPFEAIARVIERRPSLFDGCGIVLGELSTGEHLCGVDLDSCLDDDGVLAEWAKLFVEGLQTYGEVSPSGGGLKQFFAAERTMRARCGPPSHSPMARGVASELSARTAPTMARPSKSTSDQVDTSPSPANSGHTRLMFCSYHGTPCPVNLAYDKGRYHTQERGPSPALGGCTPSSYHPQDTALLARKSRVPATDQDTRSIWMR